MPYRRKRYRRKKRPYKKKRGYRRKRVYKRKRKPNIISLPRQILPSRGFATHTCIRYIRIPSRLASGTPPEAVQANWEMPNWGTPFAGSQKPFNTLFISVNDPMAPFNELGVPNSTVPGSTTWPAPNTPAFLCDINDAGQRTEQSQALFDTAPNAGGDVPPQGSPTGYRNFYGSYWQKMKSFYEKFTVVGSECTISMYPDPVYSVEYARQASKHCMFTMGVAPTRDGATYETTQQQQAFNEQPGFITREFHGRTQSNGRSAAITMKRKWSAKRNMGLSKGNIIGNNAITGDALAQYTQQPCGLDAPNQWSFATSTTQVQEVSDQFAKHPAQQQYFAFSGNSLLSNNTRPGAYELAEWPSCLLRVTLKYHTVWHDRRFVNNELI